MPAQSGLQSGEQVYTLLAQRGQVPANAAEGNRSRFAAERAGDLLLHFDHANISLGLVIVKRHSEVFQEGVSISNLAFCTLSVLSGGAGQNAVR